jgi:hypothetical protein
MFPEFTAINGNIKKKILSRNATTIPQQSIFIRAISGADNGVILQSNVNWDTFKDDYLDVISNGGANVGQKIVNAVAFNKSLYGHKNSSGTIGIDWDGAAVNPDLGRGGRPSPIITMFTVREGMDQISRSATMNISCYSLEQLEKIQKYFLEPGYTLFIEWGWNTDTGKLGLTKLKDKSGKIDASAILSTATSRGLDNDTLKSIRTQCKGDYDCYFGFITGGNVKSEADLFNIQVEMQGVPSLPTWLQSHQQMYSYDKTDGTTKTNNGTDIFSYDDTTWRPAIGNPYNGFDEIYAVNRRAKSLFNALPPQRQTEEVKAVLKNSKMDHYINFDELIVNEIKAQTSAHWYEYVRGIVEWRFLEVSEKVQAANGTIPRAMFTNSDSYIRFKLAIDILNANGNLEEYTIGSKALKTKIETDDTMLPAFPFMFSTKRDKLVIPGIIPNFFKYFDNANIVTQTDLYDQPSECDQAIFPLLGSLANAIRFVQKVDTPAGSKFTEKAHHWGYLNDLYINFNFFKETITQDNKNIREILLDLLNGMSSAVNSFWNFQIVEGKDSNGVMTYKIIDENWSGHYPSNASSFQHSGMMSPFLEANLEIAMSAEMANQIIARREELAINPNQAIVDTTTFFGSYRDRFLSIKKNAAGGNAAPSNVDSVKIYNDNLNKLAILPQPTMVQVTPLPVNALTLSNQYAIYTFDDTNLFEVLRNKAFYKFKKDNPTVQRVSPLLPIKYSFKTFGISGIERGNTFNITGIPSKYKDNGFFQVTEVEHEISGMNWTTTVVGGYRQRQ